MKPLFSIIIPTYNRRQFLKIAIDSVFSQTFKDWQLIIVDDGSKDNTKELICSYKDLRLKYYHQPNQGPATARNTGLSKATGDYICFLDSDDRFRKDKLEIAHQYIRENPGYKIFHTEEIWYRNGKILTQKKPQKKSTGFIFEKSAKLCSISISTAIIKKDIFKKIGCFDQALPACEDYDFWLRTTARYPLFLIPDFLTIKEGGHKGQQSKKYPGMDKFRIYSLLKILENKDINSQCQQIAYQQLKNKCIIYLKGAKKRKKRKEIKKYQGILTKYKKIYESNFCEAKHVI